MFPIIMFEYWITICSYNWGFFSSYLSLPLRQLSRYPALQGRWIKPRTRHHCPAWNFRACFWTSLEEMKVWKQSILWENIWWHLKGVCSSQRTGFKHRIEKNTRWARAMILDACPSARVQRWGDQPAGERIKEMGLWFKWVPNMEPRSSAP